MDGDALTLRADRLADKLNACIIIAGCSCDAQGNRPPDLRACLDYRALDILIPILELSDMLHNEKNLSGEQIERLCLAAGGNVTIDGALAYLEQLKRLVRAAIDAAEVLDLRRIGSAPDAPLALRRWLAELRAAYGPMLPDTGAWDVKVG